MYLFPVFTVGLVPSFHSWDVKSSIFPNTYNVFKAYSGYWGRTQILLCLYLGMVPKFSQKLLGDIL